MNRKYIFFDIDGTLTDLKTGELVPSAVETIEKLKEAGHFVSIATGRAYYKTKKIAQMAHIDHVVANGGACLVYHNKVIKNSPLDKEKAIQLLKEADLLGLGILISPNDSIDVIMKDERFIKQVGFRQEPTRYFYQKDLDFEDISDIYKIYIAYTERIENLTLKDILGHIHFVDKYLTYQHDAKDQGIKEMIGLAQGKDEDVFVFGDGENDLVMFKDEWTKIAMSNGYPELLNKADYITDTPVQNGIQKACLKYGLIK
ncbi:HAD-IIB family hydrolase [Eggerthia catenaformis]|uniref:HAD-IIB family hydrolase n=1 Tax=Eggerthia catenaformis TaxID=31973 RepID=UPI00248D724C|nr:HAD-IIB family hydrolase [Eggerthia catenaformis]